MAFIVGAIAASAITNAAHAAHKSVYRPVHEAREDSSHLMTKCEYCGRISNWVLSSAQCPSCGANLRPTRRTPSALESIEAQKRRTDLILNSLRVTAEAMKQR